MNVSEELKVIAGRNAHPEYPLLRVDYSPTSRYPATDFTQWVSKQIADENQEALAYLLVQLTIASPGIGLGADHWKAMAAKLLAFNIRDSIQSSDYKAYSDLHSALFTYILHGPLDGFMLVSLHVEYLARIMTPYKFSIPDVSDKVRKANSFIQKMRDETKNFSAAWTGYPLIDSTEIEACLKAEPPSSELRSILRELSIGSRLLFLGTVEQGTGQGSWKVRPFGINECEQSQELVQAQLGTLNHDPEMVLSSYRNQELLAALSGYPTKQGWKKKYIIKFMLDNATGIADRLCEGKEVFAANPQWNAPALELIQWSQTLLTPLAVALAFN